MMIKGFFNTQIIKYPYIFDNYRRLKRILGSSNPFYSYLDKFSNFLVQNNYRLESLYGPRGLSNNDTIAIKSESLHGR